MRPVIANHATPTIFRDTPVNPRHLHWARMRQAHYQDTSFFVSTVSYNPTPRSFIPMHRHIQSCNLLLSSLRCSSRYIIYFLSYFHNLESTI